MEVDPDGNDDGQFFYIGVYASNGLKPCNPCESTNDATDYNYVDYQDVMYNGPNYTSNSPNHWFGPEFEGKDFIWYYLNTQTNAYSRNLTGGAPPPNNQWMTQSNYPTDDCVPWHLATSSCATIVTSVKGLPTPSTRAPSTHAKAT